MSLKRLLAHVGHDEMLWTILRLSLAGLIAAHGLARITNGAVTPFGEWLDNQGLFFGAAIAWSITVLEIAGTFLIAIRKHVFPLTVLFICIYLVGLFMVHAPHGWFVVGLGRNGMEYSVLLIVCLLITGLHYRQHTN